MTPTCSYTVKQNDDELVIECPCDFATEEEYKSHGLGIARVYVAQLKQEVLQ